MAMKWWEKTALVLAAIGAINWGLVGVANLDVVNALLGKDVLGTGVVATIVYVLVGLSGLWMIYKMTKK